VAAAAAAAPLHPGLREREFRDSLESLRARALIVAAGSDTPAAAVAQQLSIPILQLEAIDPAGGFRLVGGPASGGDLPDAARPEDTALLLHSWASVRAVRVDTAVAKALGMSGRQLFLSLIAEKWLMGGVAIVAGAAIGYWPGLELVQLLDSTSNSMGPLPPMIPEVNIPLLASVLAGLAVAVMASAFLAAAMAQRSRAIDVLREGA